MPGPAPPAAAGVVVTGDVAGDGTGGADAVPAGDGVAAGVEDGADAAGAEEGAGRAGGVGEAEVSLSKDRSICSARLWSSCDGSPACWRESSSARWTRLWAPQRWPRPSDTAARAPSSGTLFASPARAASRISAARLS